MSTARIFNGIANGLRDGGLATTLWVAALTGAAKISNDDICLEPTQILASMGIIFAFSTGLSINFRLFGRRAQSEVVAQPATNPEPEQNPEYDEHTPFAHV